jgi:hypothetical protein
MFPNIDFVLLLRCCWTRLRRDHQRQINGIRVVGDNTNNGFKIFRSFVKTLLMKAIVIILFVVRSNLLFSDTLDLWQNPIDTINPMVVFRGNFNYFENYYLSQSFDYSKNKMIFIKGKGGYAYHYFTNLNGSFKDNKLDSNIELYQFKLFSKLNLPLRIPPRDSGKNILYFEKVRSPKTLVPFNVFWIDNKELKNTMWLDYCKSKHYINRKKLKIKCLKI